MSYIPPQSLNDAWALLAVISDPDKAKKALEELKIKRDQSMKALENARMTQMAANRMREQTAALAAELDVRKRDFEAKCAERESELTKRETFADDRAKKLQAFKEELDEQDVDTERRELELIAAQNLLEANTKDLAKRAAELKVREDYVASILKELGPLAQKLQGK